MNLKLSGNKGGRSLILLLLIGHVIYHNPVIMLNIFSTLFFFSLQTYNYEALLIPLLDAEIEV